MHFFGRQIDPIIALLCAGIIAIAAAATTAKAASPNTRGAIVKHPVAAVAKPATPWTACHLSAAAGMAAQSADVGGVPTVTSDGVLLALGAGCDYQFPNTPFVIGVAADWTWPDVAAAGAEIKGAWTVAARAGIAVTDKALIYATGGWTQQHTSPPAGVPDRFDGKMVGAGVEALISRAFSLGLEYRAIFYDAEAKVAPAVLGSIDPSEHQLRLVGKWRFDLLK